MGNFLRSSLITLPLLAVVLLLQSCDEEEQLVQPEKQRVQFNLSPESAHIQGASDIGLPQDARARITVAASNGTIVLDGHEIKVHESGDSWLTEAIDLDPGSYSITELMIVSDSTELYVTPKKGAELTTSETDALPYNFSVRPKDELTLNMPLIDVRNLDLRKLGYAALRAATLPIAVYENSKLTSAKAEIHQDKKLVQVLELTAGTNSIQLLGNPKKPYTITVYTASSAQIHTFLLKDLQKKIGRKPWQIFLVPALILGVSADDGDYAYEFNFRMEGAGAVNIAWGDGNHSATSLPFEIGHDYAPGDHTLIVTGNLNQVTDFSGFSYSTIIETITGLTNLTSLKTYDPSWGAVPIKVDLSNCKQLERINIAKYGAPFETINLATDFKLPSEHYIKTFIFDATSFDITREFISAAELAAFVDNIHANAVARNITDGKFFVNPVVAPNAATQLKLDVLTDDYNWEVGFNDDIYYAFESDAARARTAFDADDLREQWLRERFSNSEQIIERGRVSSSVR